MGHVPIGIHECFNIPELPVTFILYAVEGSHSTPIGVIPVTTSGGPVLPADKVTHPTLIRIYSFIIIAYEMYM